jgi:hypothetical protein
MTVPPYACAFVLMLTVFWGSDHFKQRGIPITALMVIAAIMYALLATLPQAALHGNMLAW